MGSTSYPPMPTYDHIPPHVKPSYLPPDAIYNREPLLNIPRQREDSFHPNPSYYTQPDTYGARQPQSMARDNVHFQRRDTNSPTHPSDLNSSSRPIPSYYPNLYQNSQDYQQYSMRNASPPVPFLPASMPPKSSFSSATSHLIDAVDNMRISSPFRPIEPNLYRLETDSSRSRTSSGFSEPTSHPNSVTSLPLELSVSDVPKYPDVTLLWAYHDAIQKKNQPLAHTIYDELQQRCYGNHPLLINEKRTLFDDKYRSLQSISVDELNRSQVRVKTQIYTTLINGDATKLDKLPHDLIIEAAALDCLIKRKTSQQ